MKNTHDHYDDVELSPTGESLTLSPESGFSEHFIRVSTTTEVAERQAGAALAEDIGPGDLSSAIFDPKQQGAAVLMAKANGVLSGTELATATFTVIGPGVRARWFFKNGDRIKPGDKIAEISGPVRLMLSAERVALNFLQHLSGIATLTRKFVDIAQQSPTKPDIVDTRKTLPMYRAWAKKAVQDGGGKNHRFGLFDMIMLKDNHIDAAGGIKAAMDIVHSEIEEPMPGLGICIETRNIAEAVEATAAGATIVMLDNMTPDQIREGVSAIHAEAERQSINPPLIEISGGVTLETLTDYASLPVQRISVGALTHSAPALDISMKYEPLKPVSTKRARQTR